MKNRIPEITILNIISTLLFLLVIGGLYAIIAMPEPVAETTTPLPQEDSSVISYYTKLNAELQHKITALTKQIEYYEKVLREERVVEVTLTSYSPRGSETDTDPYITASMEKVHEGGVAVSRDLFYKGWVFGRKVYIEGHGIFTINDLMHERKVQQVDIFQFSTKKALAFGVQHARVALLD